MFKESSCQLHQYSVHECFPHRKQSLHEANMAALPCSDQDKVGIRHSCLLGDCWGKRYTVGCHRKMDHIMVLCSVLEGLYRYKAIVHAQCKGFILLDFRFQKERYNSYTQASPVI